MPRGVYPRKKKPGAPAAKKLTTAPDLNKLVEQIRQAKTWHEDRVVVLGTAIETLETLET